MKTICPYCFKTIDLNKTDFRCASKLCLESGTMQRHIIPRKLAKVDRKGFATCDVDKCKTTTHTMVCNYCKHDLPDTISKSQTRIISIVGAKSSGKSYYVATLLRQLMEEGLFTKVTKIGSTRFIQDSREIYKTRYKDKMDNKIALGGTNYVSDIVKDNPPVLVQFTYLTSRNKRVDDTYSFFDAAGESFNDAADLAAITPYISHSSAIIIILDPRQMDDVNRSIVAHMPKLGTVPVADDRYEDTIRNVATVLRDQLRLRSDEKIKIPLCVAFSKWDLLIKTPDLLPADFIVSDPNLAGITGFNADIVKNASDEIESLLNKWEPGFVAAVNMDFKNICYFGFSAWGLGSVDGTEVPAIASFRVEDPMLWIMNQNGLL